VQLDDSFFERRSRLRVVLQLRVGSQALAIANIVYTCYVVFWIPTDGFADTACSMVSRFIGRNQAHRIGAVLRDAISGAILATVPFITVAVLAPRWFLAVFSPESDLLAQGSASLRVVALAMLIVIPGQMWFIGVEGTGDTAAALGIEAVLTITMLSIAYFCSHRPRLASGVDLGFDADCLAGLLDALL